MVCLSRIWQSDSSQNQTHSLNYSVPLGLTGTSSSLSVLGSICIFLSFYRDIKKDFSFRLLLYLTVADLFNAFGNILGVIRYSGFGSNRIIGQNASCDSDTLCVSQSFISVMASLASFWWTFLATLNHLLHYRGSRILEKKFLQILCHVIGWIFPLIIAVIALSSKVLGEGYSSSSGPWCWIKDCKDITKLSPVIWMAITGKFWEVLTYLGIFAIYLVLIFLKVKRHCRSRKMTSLGNTNAGPSYESIPISNCSSDQEPSIDDRFGILWIFLYLYVTRISGTVRYFILVVHNGSPYLPIVDRIDLVLMYIQSVGDSAQAFVNFIGLILIPYLSSKVQEKKYKNKRIYSQTLKANESCNRFEVIM